MSPKRDLCMSSERNSGNVPPMPDHWHPDEWRRLAPPEKWAVYDKFIKDEFKNLDQCMEE